MGRFLVSLPKVPMPQLAQTQAVGEALAASGYSPLSDPEFTEVVQALADGHRYSAGKLYREVTGCGPLQAKRAIERIDALRRESR